jgi:hypothetical protein
MAETVGVIPNELRAQQQTPEVVVEFGQPFPLFPLEVTKAKRNKVMDKDANGLQSSITILDPVTGFLLPLSINGVLAPDGSFGIDIKTGKLGEDLLTRKGKLRRKVYPFIAGLRLTILVENRKQEELTPKVNPKTNGISFFLPNAFESIGINEIKNIKGKLFSITAENC